MVAPSEDESAELGTQRQGEIPRIAASKDRLPSPSKSATRPGPRNTSRRSSRESSPHTPGASSNSSSKRTVNSTTRDSSTANRHPRWPIPPRLKSPPPVQPIARPSAVTPLALSARSPVPETPLTPSIKIHKSTPTESDAFPSPTEELSKEPSAPRSGTRTPQRSSESVLETVRESSVPSTPAIGSGDSSKRLTSPGDNEEDPHRPPTKLNPKGSKDGSGDSSDNMLESRSRSRTVTEGQDPSKPHSRPPNQGAKSFAAVTSRNKPATEAGNNVTVETETVSSVPQVAVGGGGGRSDTGLRSKASSETIKQKPPRRRPPRKPAAVSGPASSKAEIFEAKLVDAVGAEDGSDSEETFVYESDARDPYPPRVNRHHSRTPSTHSMASQTDPRVLPRGLSDGHVVVGKKSMKFVSNPSYGSTGAEASELQSSRRGSRVGAMERGQTSYSLRKPQTPLSAQDEHGSNDVNSLLKHGLKSPNSMKSPRSPLKLSNRQARLESPRNHAFQLGQGGSAGIGKKSPSSKFYPYDVDIEAADDESAPLINASRSMRRHSRRHGSSHGSVRTLSYYEAQRGGYCVRFGGCIILALSVSIVLLLGTGLFMSTTQPLKKVKLLEARDVLASKDELMLNLVVEALNPNLIPVTIASMDINLFAKSNYLPDEQSSHASDSSLRSGVHVRDDDPSDPDPFDPDPQTMLLGRILGFDNPLIIDGSPVQRRSTRATGEVRLVKPGNNTEAGAMKRWEKILDHRFELIVRGVLQYQLPLSSKVQSATIGARTTVYPEADLVRLRAP